jgi:hypothetical protein
MLDRHVSNIDGLERYREISVVVNGFSAGFLRIDRWQRTLFGDWKIKDRGTRRNRLEFLLQSFKPAPFDLPMANCPNQ